MATGPARGTAHGAKLTYVVQMSLDGFVADASGNFDWAAPDEEVHSFVNDLVRGAGTMLLGRRMYDVLSAWEDPEIANGEPECIADFHRIWLATEKVVYSQTLREVKTAHTRLERTFDAAAIERMKRTSSRDLSIGGPDLAAQAMRAGLVDECHLIVVPYVAGGGNRALREGSSGSAELIGERRFGNGAVYTGYRIKSASTR